MAPRNTLETGLTLIWEKLLSIQPVGVQDNFFEIGGHSLLAVQLVSEIKKELGMTLSLIALLQSPTIEQLAEVLNGEVPIQGASSMFCPGERLRIASVLGGHQYSFAELSGSRSAGVWDHSPG